MWKWEEIQELLWKIVNNKGLQIGVKTQKSSFGHPKIQLADSFQEKL